MSKNNTGKKVALGAAIVGAAGFVAGVVAANKPKSNQQTDVFESIEERLKFLHTEISDLIANTNLETKTKDMDRKAKKQLDAALSAASTSKQKLTKVLEAVKSGQVEDKDLKLALKEAENAIVHAKKFLLKK